MGKNKNEKKRPAVKKVIPETSGNNNAGIVNHDDNKSGTGKKEEDSKMKSKNR